MHLSLKNLTLFALLIGCFIPAISIANIPSELNGKSTPSLAPMLEATKPAIVSILASGRGVPEGEEPPEEENQDNNKKSRNKNFESFGSGVIIDPKQGYVLTNAHLVEQAKSITVTLSDGRHFKAKSIGTDPASDVAVIQIPANNLPAIKIGNSNEVKVGDFAVAIGNPYGLTQTVTSGIISALERNNLGIEGFEDFIQTDASINPGNSGGALVNLRGELIGINTAILAPNGANVGIGFAIPSNMALAIMEQIIQFNNVVRGVVGVMVQNLTPELSNALHESGAKGALISAVTPNSPASKAGLLPGDVIQKINQKTIETAGQVRNTIGLMRPGSNVDIQLLRDNKNISVKLVSADPEAFKQSATIDNPFFHGVVMKNFDAKVPGFDKIRGVQTFQIADNSPAWQAGIRPGDVITAINGKPVADILALESLTTKDNKELLVNIFRQNGAIFVVVKKQS